MWPLNRESKKECSAHWHSSVSWPSILLLYIHNCFNEKHRVILFIPQYGVPYILTQFKYNSAKPERSKVLDEISKIVLYMAQLIPKSDDLYILCTYNSTIDYCYASFCEKIQLYVSSYVNKEVRNTFCLYRAKKLLQHKKAIVIIAIDKGENLQCNYS